MAFTNQNDVNILQASDLAVIGAGAGDDRYIVTAATLTAGKSIQISDTQGANTLQLVGGLAITSSIVGANGVLLTLNNGATIEVLGAANFSFITGGDPLSGTGGTTQNFSQFVTQSLGIAAVPTGNATANGAAVTVNANGGTTAGGGGTPNPGIPGDTIPLTSGADNRTGTANNDIFDGSANTNANTPNTLNPFDTVNGGAGFDSIIVAQNVVDADFTGVNAVERIVTNGNTIALGSQAQRAGIEAVLNTNSAASTLTLGAGYTRENGSFSLGTNAVDNVAINNAAAGTNFRVTFASAEVGDGDSINKTAPGAAPLPYAGEAAGGLAVRVQREDGADALTGGVSRFDDEGSVFGSADGTVRFDVRDLGGASRGTFQQVSLGTVNGDALGAVVAPFAAITTTGIYINGGGGNDTIGGTANADFLVGGTGDDQITSAGGRDSVLGGGGNDRFREDVAALVNVDLGAGDDIARFENNTLAATGLPATRDTVAGGDGVDSLFLTPADVAAATAVAAGETAVITGFEVIRTGGAVTFTTANVQAGINGVVFDIASSGTVNFEAGSRFLQVGAEQVQIGGVTAGAAGGVLNNVLTVNAAGSAATDVLALNNGRQQLATGAGANVNDVFNGQAVTAGGYETLRIGTGAVVTAGQTLGNVIVNASVPETNVTVNVTGVNALSLAGNTLTSNTTGTLIVDASTMTAQNPGTATLTLTTGAQAGTGSASITGSAGDDVLATTGRAFINGGAGADNITGAAGNDTLQGGDGNDVVTIGTGNDNAAGGAGDDRVVVGDAANLTGDDTVAGGDGRDALDVSNAAIVAAGQVNVSGFEVLSYTNLAGATTQDMVQFINNATFDTIRVNSAAQNLTINNATPGIANLVFAADRNGGAVTTIANLVNTASNVLNLRAESAANPNVALTRTVTGAITLNNVMGQGTDTLNVGDRTNALMGDQLTIGALNGADLDTINVTGLAQVSITAGTLNGTARNVTVNATANTGATFTFDGSDAGSNGVQFVLNGSSSSRSNLTGNQNSDTLTGGSVGDSLVGRDGADVINGNGGADTIVGGDGRDTINGGDGVDIYQYANAAQSNLTAGPAALAFDTVTVTAGDTYDNTATAVAAARQNEFTILGAAPADAAGLTTSLTNAFMAARDAVANNVEAILVEFVTGGRQFLLVDLNGNDAFEATTDQVIEIVGAVNTLTLVTGDVVIS